MTPKAPSSPETPRFTLQDLAERLGGRAEGDHGLVISGVASIAEAGPSDLTFVEKPRLAAQLSDAGAVLVQEGLELPGRNLIRVGHPRLAFAAALGLFHPATRPPAGVHPSAVVEEGAAIDPTASVSALCFVGSGARIGARSVLHPLVHIGREAVVGEDVLLHPGALVLERVVLGDRVILHSGSVVGSDGFGYVFNGREHRKIPQVGTVEIGDDVEIGAGTTVDRATTGVTRIGRGTKVDNLVQIAHNTLIGEDVILVAQSGLAGSATVGNGSVLGGRVAVVDHAIVGARARVAGRSSVLSHVPDGAAVAGFGPQPHRDFLKSQAVFEQLPALRRQVADLEKRLAAAEAAAGIATEPGR